MLFLFIETNCSKCIFLASFFYFHKHANIFLMGPNMKLLQQEKNLVCWKMFWKVKKKKTVSSSTNQGKLYQKIVIIINISLILIPILLLLIWFVFHTLWIWTILCSILFFLAWIANINDQICLEVQKHGQHVLLVKNVRFLVVDFEWFSL